MSPVGHLIGSVLAGGAVSAATGRFDVGVACVLAGILIDLDHFIDYFWYEGLRLDLRDFQRACEETRFDKTLLVLHSWELLAAAWGLSLWVFPNPVFRGIIVGLSLHMVCDQLRNEPFPLAYFLGYRAAVRFDAARIFKPAARRRAATAALARSRRAA